mmetsp:Transcript_35898/g.71121  ORF Transcript_35898/g.71121 Transcript_35898/m.71121 type:complete len:172 (-) Transcript_35898:178-693(-)
MSFARASKDRFYFNGSDDSLAPDYVKNVPPQTWQCASAKDQRTASSASGSSRMSKPPLPRVSLKTERRFARCDVIKRSRSASQGRGAGDALTDADIDPNHPLRHYSKPHAVVFSGRLQCQDGELGKITKLPYRADDCRRERQIAHRSKVLTQTANLGLGYGLFGVESEEQN